MAEYKRIALDPETYAKLARLAEANKRTLGGQASVLIEGEYFRVVSIETLPYPVDAMPVPLVTIAPAGEQA